MDDAEGYLIGEPNQGMRYMITMMDNARLCVGVQGLAVAERAYHQAVGYARERHHGRAVGIPAGTSSPIIDHPDVRRMLLTLKASIEAVRSLAYLLAESMDLAAHHPDGTIREAARELVELLTPVTKAWGTDLGVELTSLALQLHGGAGYIEETRPVGLCCGRPPTGSLAPTRTTRWRAPPRICASSASCSAGG